MSDVMKIILSGNNQLNARVLYTIEMISVLNLNVTIPVFFIVKHTDG